MLCYGGITLTAVLPVVIARITPPRPFALQSASEVSPVVLVHDESSGFAGQGCSGIAPYWRIMLCYGGRTLTAGLAWLS